MCRGVVKGRTGIIVRMPAMIVEIKGAWRGPPPSIDSGYAVVAMINMAKNNWSRRNIRSHGSGLFQHANVKDRIMLATYELAPDRLLERTPC